MFYFFLIEEYDDEENIYYQSTNGAKLWDRPESMDIVPEELEIEQLHELIERMSISYDSTCPIESLIELGYKAKELLSISEQDIALNDQRLWEGMS